MALQASPSTPTETSIPASAASRRSPDPAVRGSGSTIPATTLQSKRRNPSSFSSRRNLGPTQRKSEIHRGSILKALTKKKERNGLTRWDEESSKVCDTSLPPRHGCTDPPFEYTQQKKSHRAKSLAAWSLTLAFSSGRICIMRSKTQQEPGFASHDIPSQLEHLVFREHCPCGDGEGEFCAFHDRRIKGETWSHTDDHG